MRILTILLASLHVQASQYDNRTITVAVVEYQSTRSPTSDVATITANTDRYVDLATTLAHSKPDLIVFPEKTLLMLPPIGVEVQTNDNPCESRDFPSEVLRKLSCAARDSNAYLLVNLVDKRKCQGQEQNSNCKQHGFLFYNTNIIFDRRGTVVSRYRKYNLFGEKEYDKPPTPEEEVVELDVGVKYGVFTCFDILFKAPAQDMLRMNVDGVVYPSMWHSELPFLTALQAQQMWAHAHNLKLFSAGANNPAVSSGGSGFFSGAQGMIVGDIVASGGTKTHIYKYVTGEAPTDYNPQVPTVEEDPDVLGAQMDDFVVFTDPSVKEYSSVILDTSQNDFTKELCHGDGKQCCQFDVKMASRPVASGKVSYVYHLVAYSGIRSLADIYNAGIELCGVIACLNGSLSSCGQRFASYADIDWPLTFELLAIKSNFEKSEARTQYPNSVLSSMRPINASETVWTGREVALDGRMVVERTFALKEPQSRVLTFAIYGRNFADDSPPDGGSAAVAVAMLIVEVMYLVV